MCISERRKECLKLFIQRGKLEHTQQNEQEATLKKHSRGGNEDGFITRHGHALYVLQDVYALHGSHVEDVGVGEPDLVQDDGVDDDGLVVFGTGKVQAVVLPCHAEVTVNYYCLKERERYIERHRG